MIHEKGILEYFKEYIKECEYSSRLRPQTVKGYSDVFKLFMLLMPEVSCLELLTAEMLTEFFRRLQERERQVGNRYLQTGIKSSTIKTYRSKLNSFFEWMKARNIIPGNPLRNVLAPEVLYEDTRSLTEPDIRKIYAAITLHAANAFIIRRDTAMVSLLVFCGVRLGEFISLEVRDIDLEKKLLTVRSNTSKSKKMRRIPIHATLLHHLREYLTERNKHNYKTQFLFVSSNCDNGLTCHGLKYWVKTLRKRSGVAFHLHQFRHYFACTLARKDVNAVKIQKLLGHSSLNMTMTYLRAIGTEELHEDINKLFV